MPKGLYKPLRIVLLFSISLILFKLSSLISVRACLSTFSLKPYSLHSRLILDVGVSESKSIFISHSESVSMEFTTSLIDELISKFGFSKGGKYFLRLGSSPINVFLNSTYLGLFLSAHHKSLMIDFRISPLFAFNMSMIF